MKKPKVKMLLKLTAAVLSVVMMLCALPLGALASEVRTAPTSLENGVTVEKPQSQKVYDGEMLSGVENIDTSLSETEPTSPLTEVELSTIIKNGKMERITADNVPDAVGFESAKSKNHVARAFEKEKDELNSLVFLNEDGTYTKYLYDYPVKFVDESGSIKDTSLDIVAEANGSYKRKQGGTSASFSKKVADGIKLSGDGASISLYPKIPTQVRQPVVTGEIGKLPLKSLLYSAENINSLDKKTVSYYYNDSTSLEYSLTYTGFKEDIVVSEYTGQTEYVFTLKTGGLTLTEDNGNFYLTDKNGNTKATLGQIIIFTADERNNTFGSMSAVAVKENEEYTVTIHVDAEYLKDEKTVYPIRIDPTIELTENGTSLVEDVVVNSNDTVSHRTTEALRVGKNEDGTYSRILIKFNYDFGSFADGPLKIHRAYVEMRDVMCQTESMTVMSEMYIGTNWSEDADWSAIARGVHTHYMASMPINYNKGNGYTEKHRYSISVLDAVKYWVAEANNTPDYYQASPQGGIMIKAYDAVEQGTTPIQKYFASSQYAETAYRPSLSVTYYDTHTQYSDPFGHLDAVTSNSIRGWVWCVDLPNESVPVTIYLKNKTTGENYPGITLTGEDTALYRPDVHDGDYGTGCYGFNYPIDWTKYSAGEYEVSAKWHSMNGTGLVYDLFNSPKTYNNVGVRLSEQNLMLGTGDTTTLTATTFIDGTTGWSVAWSSTNESVATVDSNGNITAIGHGTAVISAQYTRNYVASCSVSVGHSVIINGRKITVFGEDDELLDDNGESQLTGLHVYANNMRLSTARQETNGDVTVCMAEIADVLCTDYQLKPGETQWYVSTSHKDLKITCEKTYSTSELGICPSSNINDRISITKFVEDLGYTSKYCSVSYSNGARVIIIQGHDWPSSANLSLLTGEEFVSLTLSCLPWVGDAKDLVEGIGGKDLITGEELSLTDRIICIGCTLAPVLSGSSVRVGRKGFAKIDNIVSYADTLSDTQRIVFNSDIWNVLRPTTRGLVIEAEFAHKVYKVSNGWYHIGKEMNGFFPVIDFIKDAERIEDVTAVSMKTLDPRLYKLADGSYNFTRIKKVISGYAEKLTGTDIFINGVSVSNRKLDLVLPKGFISIIDENIDLSMFGDVINFLEV